MESRVLETFQKWDVNQDGLISEDELMQALKQLGFCDKEISVLLKAADTNRDGKVDYQEFLSWVFSEAPSTIKDYVGMKLKFTTKPGGDDYANCSGTYVLDPAAGDINGKSVYINHAKGKFLAATSSEVGWCITALVYLDEIKSQGGGGFGGFHAGGGDEPEDGEWPNYTVDCCVVVKFMTKHGCDNYADCSGEYVLDHSQGTINGKPIYVNHAKKKFLAATSSEIGWCITGLVYLDEIKAQGSGGFGGFHAGGGDNPEEGDWSSYHVTCSGRRARNAFNDIAKKSSAWKKLENTTVSIKAVRNSGVIRTDGDFFNARLMCLKADCGGFAWRKPHFNQFGEEDDPPVCFFFRNTQQQLLDALQPSEAFDFYLAPDSFCPDCSFKSGRDPAPSCHIRWNIEKPVHAFAGQVCVTEPTACTYYCVGGFHCGYCGIQQHNGTKQQVLFSVWDHGSADGRVENLRVCDGMVAKPFGGEGKGMGSYAVTGTGEAEDARVGAWTPGETYTFLVRSTAVDNGSEYSCSLHKPGEGWIELACHLRPEPAHEIRGKLRGLYSFIEDFASNSLRRSSVSAAWVQEEPESPWQAVRSVQGTSTAECDIPNKRVCLVSLEEAGGACQRVQMVSGGDALPEYELYSGDVSAPDVPECLQMRSSL